MADTLSPPEIAALRPSARPERDPLAAMRERLARTGQWAPHQMAGRRWPMACVSLELTQRCNLDCTLCYLSDSAEPCATCRARKCSAASASSARTTDPTSTP